MKISKSLRKNRSRSGFIISLELILISSILVIGLITGLVAVRDAVVTELGDVASAIGQTNQSYYYTGTSAENPFDVGIRAYTRGAAYIDQVDYDSSEISIFDAPVSEGPRR
ncbi:MAG: hypothetical protein R3F19_27735 [Verrucomicrobiales bacterium]